MLSSHIKRSYTTIRSLLEQNPVGTHTTVQGYIRSVRRSKNVAFLVLNDGSTNENLQAVLTPQQGQEERLRTGASVKILGQFSKSIKGTQAYELKASTVSILGDSTSEYPIQKQYHSAEFLRSIAHLRVRTQFSSSLLRLQSELLHGLSVFFRENHFTQTMPPILTSSDCEGAGEVFSIKNSENFFGLTTYLTVSSQLHLEALAVGLNKVWTITPTFRAEKSTTARHLAEFRMIEAEINFTDDLDEVMDVVEAMVRHLAGVVQELPLMESFVKLQADNQEGIDLSARCRSLKRPNWTRITYNEAVEILANSGEKFEFEPRLGSSLQAEHEKWLASHFDGPVFVKNYPASMKPFYMLPIHSDSDLSLPQVECFDLLVPSMGELCGGSLREHRFAELQKNMPAGQEWYADIRKYGSVRHGGFGVGFERLVAYLAGVSNVREIAAFPRWVNHCLY